MWNNRRGKILLAFAMAVSSFFLWSQDDVMGNPFTGAPSLASEEEKRKIIAGLIDKKDFMGLFHVFVCRQASRKYFNFLSIHVSYT